MTDPCSSGLSSPCVRAQDIVNATGVGIRGVTPPYDDTAAHSTLITRLQSAKISLIRFTPYINENITTYNGPILHQYANAGIRICLLGDLESANYAPVGKRDASQTWAQYITKMQTAITNGDWPVPTWLENLNEPGNFFLGQTLYGNGRGGWANSTTYAVADTVTAGTSVVYYCIAAHTTPGSGTEGKPDGTATFFSANWVPVWTIYCGLHDDTMTTWRASKASWGGVKLTTPSLFQPTEAAQIVQGGGTCDAADTFNIHIYSTPPELGPPSWLGLVRSTTLAPSNTETIITEYGWGWDVVTVDTDMAAYHVRAILNFAKYKWSGHNLTHWFAYEMCGPSVDIDFGLCDSTGTARLPFTEISRLLNRLYDPGPTATTFTPVELYYRLDTAGGILHTFPIQRSDGKFDIAYWSSFSTTDAIAATLTFDRTYSAMENYRPRGDATSSVTPAQTVAVTVRGDAQLLRVTP